MNKKYKRKLIVDRKYQTRQVITLIIANILIVLLISALLSWFYLIAWDGSTAYNHNAQIPIYIAVCGLIVTILTVILSFRRSRSIAGMMHKVQEVLEDAGHGIFPERKLVFRKSDYFTELAEPLNARLKELEHNSIHNNQTTVIMLKKLTDEVQNQQIDMNQLHQKLQQILARFSH